MSGRRPGHALIGARQWIPGRADRGPGEVPGYGTSAGPAVPHQGAAGHRHLTDAYADGLAFDFICGDEVYGSCTGLREFLEQRGQGYVLRVASTFMITLPPGTRMTCADAVKKLLKDKNGRWEVRSAGKGSKGERWYAWAWIATASPRHSLLVRRHLKTGELAFHYCLRARGPAGVKARLIRAAGLRWPVEEGFEFGKDYFGLDQCQARLYTAILPPPRARHGRPRRLRRHRRPAQGPHRRPGAAARPARRAAAPRPWPDPAHRPRGKAAARRRPQPAAPARPRRPLARMETPPPGTIPLVPPARTPGTQLPLVS